MFDVTALLHTLFWPLAALFVVAIGFALLELFFRKPGKDLSAYIKKSSLFDTKTEFELFKILLELYSDKFYIFPQVGYIHLVQVRKDLTRYEQIRYRNSIDRKSADFVLCDKEQVVPQLVIELDGSSHDWSKRKDRDGFIDEIMRSINLPILHIKTANMDREFIKSEVEKKLAVK